MSSLIGHALLAAGIYKLRDKSSSLFWFAMITVTALFPDIDYVIKSLNSSHCGLRITHSLAFSLILPLLILTVSKIYFFNRERENSGLKWVGLQLIAAGWSHLMLDLLVGVTPAPLLWPFSRQEYKLNFGLLPSAGTVSFTNFYFYRNLALEMAILAPSIYLVLRFINNKKLTLKELFLLFIVVVFVIISFNLKR